MTSIFLIFTFLLTFGIGPCPVSFAQVTTLPVPGTRIALSPAVTPPRLDGIKIDHADPFRLDFILDTGNSGRSGSAELRQDSLQLVKYFLAALTVPQEDLWVNLSPYEKDRIVPEAFGLTEMGRDLLAQDYILKQITSSLIYPESPSGREFWQKVYTQAQQRFGTTDIPIDSFNKVWIMPDKALVYEANGTAFVVDSSLKVMLDQDHMATGQAAEGSPHQKRPGQNGGGKKFFGHRAAAPHRVNARQRNAEGRQERPGRAGRFYHESGRRADRQPG